MNRVVALWRWLITPDSSPPPTPPTQRYFGLTLETWLAILCGAVLPVLVVCAVPSPLNQLTEIDPSLYAALAVNYGELTDRFGATYYATRISYIAPAALFYTLFGLDLGYLLFRCVLLSLLCSSVFFLIRNWFGLAAGVFFSALTAAGPWMLRSLLWDYTDGVAVTYLISALALVTDRNGGAWRAVAAGAMFAFAVNAGQLNLAIGGAFIFSWLMLLRLSVFSVLRRAVLIVTGFVAVYAIMSAAVYLLYPIMGPFFESTNINTANQLLSGGGAAWFTPLAGILELGMYYSLVPLVTLLVLGIVMLRNFAKGDAERGEIRLQWAAFIYLAIICAGIGFMHFALRMATLSLVWGVIYAYPATLFAWAAILAPGLERMRARAKLLTVAIGVSAVLAFFFAARFWLPDSRAYWDAWDAEIGVAIAAIVIVAIFIKRARVFMLAGLVLLAAHMPYRYEKDNFTRMHDSSLRNKERSVRDAGRQLLELVAERAPVEQGRLVIWHPTPAPLEFHSITSFLFWGYSLIDFSGGDLPNLSDDDADEIRTVGFLVIMAPTSEEIDAGLETLNRRNIGYSVLTREARQDFSYHYALLDIETGVERAAGSAPLHEYALVDIVAHTDAVRVSLLDGGGAQLISDPRQWAYSAHLVLGEQARALGATAALLVDVQVERGSFQIMVESHPNLVRPPPQESVHAGARRTILLPLDPSQDQTLVIANASPGGPSRGVIYDVRLVPYTDAQQ